MGLLKMVFGHTCEMCGRRGQDVVWWRTESKYLDPKCKRKLRAADNGRPYGATAAGYRPGQPPKLAGPMGSAYRGPAPKPQRRSGK